MEVEEICRKLKPVLGAKADALWLAYVTASTPAEKQEIVIALNILASQRLQASYEPNRVLLPPPPKHAAAGPYRFGTVSYNGQDLYPFGLREDEWIQHIGIFGRSGAGKTNLALNIVQSLLEHGKPFLIFDWKRNYRDLLTLFPGRPIRVFTVGRDIAPIQFNPLIPPAGTSPDIWLKKLIEIIATTYFVGEGVISLLLKALDEVYTEAGVYDGAPLGEWPTLRDVLTWLKAYPARGREQNWMASTLRAVAALCYGEMGKVVNVSRQYPLSGLLQENVVLELDSLTSSDKTFFIESLLLWIHHFRMAEQGREAFKHVILIEEAHHILTKQEASRKEGITDIILREIRELGESIMLLDQMPSLITPTALANTHTTFTFNLKNRGCVSTAANYTLVGNDDKEFFGRLPVGEAIVKLQGRWFDPFLITIPRIRIRKGSVTDAMLRIRNRDDSTDSAPITRQDDTEETITAPPAADKEQLSDDHLTLLKDVVNYPLDGVSRRYQRLRWSRRHGNEVKIELVQGGLLREVSLPLANGRMVLLEATPDAASILPAPLPEAVASPRNQSLEHRFWVQRVRSAFEADGYTVEEEHPVNGGAVDLLAARGGEQVGIEIETGKSDIPGNIRRAAVLPALILVATSSAAERQIARALGEADPATAAKTRIQTWKEFS